MTDFGSVLVSGLSHSGGIENAPRTTAFISKPVKGAGALNRSNGLQIIQIETSNFTGNVSIEASISKSPNDGPWVAVPMLDMMTGDNLPSIVFDYTPLVPGVASTGKPIKTNKFYSITGQFYWLRANVSNVSYGILESVKVAF